jgi:hypothetical protein
MVVLQELRIQLLDPSMIVCGREETGLVVREDGIVVMDSIVGTISDRYIIIGDNISKLL